MPLPILVTLGEPCGIGPELMLRLWMEERHLLPPFAWMANPEHLTMLCTKFNWPISVAYIDTPKEAGAIFLNQLPVIPVELDEKVVVSSPNFAHGKAICASIAQGVDWVKHHQASAIVTLPIQKQSLSQSGFAYPGHTEYLAHLDSPDTKPMMMLACADLKVVPLTTHLPLKKAIGSISAASIYVILLQLHQEMRRNFNLDQPRIAVAALNPHAGEHGTLGREEIEHLEPAIQRAQAEGILAIGPLAADSLFHEKARKSYDVCLCMYHDQALIPIKTLDFFGGVNITLGLSFIRTSVDHGTAFDLAGTGKGNYQSLKNALIWARTLADKRKMLCS